MLDAMQSASASSTASNSTARRLLDAARRELRRLRRLQPPDQHRADLVTTENALTPKFFETVAVTPDISSSPADVRAVAARSDVPALETGAQYQIQLKRRLKRQRIHEATDTLETAWRVDTGRGGAALCWTSSTTSGPRSPTRSTCPPTRL